MINTATLLGSSSGRNAGDAALMSGIMDSVDAACGTRLLYEIPTIKPSFVQYNYENRVKPVGMLPWNASLKMLGLPCYQSIMRTDISLVFDAILFDRSLYNPLFNFLSTLYLFLPRAKRAGKRLAFFNVGAGPVSTPRGKEMLREIAEHMDFITVRDQDSYDILRDIGVKNPRMILTADAALNVQASGPHRVRTIFGDLGLTFGDPVYAINVNTYLDSWASPNRKPMAREKFIAVYAAAINRLARKIDAPILFVCTQHDDIGITNEIKARVHAPRGTAIITNVDYSHYDVKGVLRSVSVLHAMRLHATILASSELTPVAGLAYQPKVAYYFKLLGLPEACMSFDDFSEDALYEHLLAGWESRDAARARITERMPELKQEALKAATLVAALRNGEDIDRAIAGLSSAPQIDRSDVIELRSARS